MSVVSQGVVDSGEVPHVQEKGEPHAFIIIIPKPLSFHKGSQGRTEFAAIILLRMPR